MDVAGLARIAAVAAGATGLRLLVLHGSRARGTHRPDSDWDFAFLASDRFDPDALLARLSERLGADAIDLADLSRASALLRFRVAGDGVLIYEREAGLFRQFRLDTVSTWCDMEPVLRREYDIRLARPAS